MSRRFSTLSMLPRERSISRSNPVSAYLMVVSVRRARCASGENRQAEGGFAGVAAIFAGEARDQPFAFHAALAPMRQPERGRAIRAGAGHDDRHLHPPHGSAIAGAELLLERDGATLERGDAQAFELVQKVVEK